MINMQGLNLRELESLRAMMISGTTKGAALSLGVSQPTVSRAIAQLEARLGSTLFVRHKGRLLPTTEASTINSSLEQLFDLLNSFEKSIPKQRVGGILRLAVRTSYSGRFIQRFVSDFLSMHPSSEVKLEASNAEGVAALVANGEADIGLVDTRLLHDGVTLEPLADLPVSCVMRTDHPLAAREAVRPSDLRGQSFVRVNEGTVTTLVERTFAEAGVECLFKVETSSPHFACECVADGLGVAVMNAMPVADEFRNRIVAVPFLPRVLSPLSFVVPAKKPLNWEAKGFMRSLKVRFKQE